ncbi:MAG: hypothetical protein PVG65_00225 [Candidatus Thorarchaeota archaeon]|jgi:hypothetical protein
MKKSGTFNVKWNWKFTLKDDEGNIISESELCNTIVNNGLTKARNLFFGDAVNVPVALAIGTDNTAVQNSDTALGTEYTRATAVKTKSGDYAIEYTYDFTFGSGVSMTVYEAGLFDNSVASGSIMIARVVDSGKAVTTASTLTVTCTITFARA